ncbi:MAG: ribosomal protein S18 acetylase RimI-like enzyme [Patescibacteria group bacterium]
MNKNIFKRRKRVKTMETTFIEHVTEYIPTRSNEEHLWRIVKPINNNGSKCRVDQAIRCTYDTAKRQASNKGSDPIILYTDLEKENQAINPKRLQIHNTISRNIPEIAEIEFETKIDPWNSDKLYEELYNMDVVQICAIHGGQMVGYSAYKVGEHAQILNLGIRPEVQGQGVEKHLLDTIYSSSQYRKKTLQMTIRETDKITREALIEYGFQALNMTRDYYENPNEDAYNFIHFNKS